MDSGTGYIASYDDHLPRGDLSQPLAEHVSLLNLVHT